MLGPLLQWINKIYKTIDSNLTHKVDADISSRQPDVLSSTQASRLDANVSSRSSHSAQDVDSYMIVGAIEGGHGQVGDGDAKDSTIIINVSGSGKADVLWVAQNHQGSLIDIEIDGILTTLAGNEGFAEFAHELLNWNVIDSAGADLDSGWFFKGIGFSSSFKATIKDDSDDFIHCAEAAAIVYLE